MLCRSTGARTAGEGSMVPSTSHPRGLPQQVHVAHRNSTIKVDTQKHLRAPFIALGRNTVAVAKSFTVAK
eukprot:5475424-Amphidinium_carterae.2